MSLLDLKSDLSKYRWKGPTAPVDPNSRTPRAVQYGDNFASFQPISNTFINRGDLPKINSPKEVDLIGKLDSTRLDDIQNTLTDSDVTKKLDTTRLDDIQKPRNVDILVNSVSQLSPQNKDYNKSTFGKTSVTDVVSQLSRIETNVSQTNITESNVDIIKRDNQTGNIRIPDINIERQPQELPKAGQAPFIIKDPTEAINNIKVPIIPITIPRQTKDRETESPNINDNPQAFSLLVNNDTNTILSDSKLDLNGSPIKYNPISRIARAFALSDLNLDAIAQTNPSGRHETDSNSNLSNKFGQELNQFPDDNASGFTNNAEPLRTEYRTSSSTLGYDTIIEANYFDVTNKYTRDGFHAFAQPGETTKYKTDASDFDWDGLRRNAPSVNYLDINNKNTTEGFHTFSLTRERTRYKVDSSDFDWDGLSVNAPSVNYFDRNNRNTIQGFHTFAFEREDTKYKTDSSRFDWDGLRAAAPTVNYFDLTNQSTVRGFHKFASTKEPTSYPTIPTLAGLSAYNNRPVILRRNATQFDWDGFRTNAPAVNFFDLTNPFSTWRGFHNFARTQEPTSYNTTANGQLVLAGGRAVTLAFSATRFDWNGVRRNAPAVNFFDLTLLNTWRGFHRFAFEREPTSYQTIANGQLVLQGGPPVTLTNPATRFDWNGFRRNAPAVNFFDLISRRTWRGFHTFAFELEPTSYQTIANGQLVLQGGPPVTLTPGPLGATRFDWDGLRAAAPAVNFFDLNRPFATWNNGRRGFHTFALPGPFEPTAYVTTAIGQLVSSFGPPVILLPGPTGPTRLDWDGFRANAPAVNFFDLNTPFATWNNGRRGFHTFALSGPFEPTAYVTTAIGQLVTPFGPPVILLPGPTGPTQLDWDGFRANAPAVNFFDLNPVNLNTWRGFHTFAIEREPTSYQTTANGQVVTQFGPPITLTVGPLGASRFDWDGTMLNAPAVNYFDFGNQWTFRGFHTFASTAAGILPGELTSYLVQTLGNVLILATRTSRNQSFSSGPWFGPRANAAFEVVNYFDLSAPFRTRNGGTRGFHAFAQPLEPTAFRTIAATPSSRTLPTFFGSPIDLHWSGARTAAPAVNFFDANNVRTTRGFHILARTKEPTSYQTQVIGGVIRLRPGASLLNWPISPSVALIPPRVDFFPNTSTRRGFHVFAREKEQTSYRTVQSGLVEILDRFASFFDWDGFRTDAPPVNFFDLTPSGANFRTRNNGRRGFHTFASPGEQTAFVTQATNTGARTLPTFFGRPFDLHWVGGRLAAPAVDFFPNWPNRGGSTTRGFHTFATPLEPTSYATIQSGNVIALRANATTFDWNGSRNAAPAVNYFDPFNINTVRGFNTFAGSAGRISDYNILSGVNPLLGSTSNFLSPIATGFDWDGLDPYSMRTTRFFGFTQTTRFGFMVNMSQFDGTAYPIITPRFNANILGLPGFPQRLQRFALNTIRQVAQPLQTRDLEQFAPLTFSGKTISGFRSTLDIQIPAVTIQKLNLNIATNRVRINPAAPNFTKRYTTGGGVDVRPSVVDGNMESWSNGTNRLIDNQHSKYSLSTEAYNDDIFIGQPFVDGSLKGPDFLKISKFDDGLVRGGVIANTVRTFLDTKRIGKFLLSGRGILWNIKQAGLQAMNPNVDIATRRNPVETLLTLGRVPTQVYNPLSVPANIIGRSALIGKRFTRHGILMDGVSGRYESVSIERALNLDDYNYFGELDGASNNNYNRLIGLVKELLPNSYDTIRENRIPQKDTDLEINRISSGFGGPNSLLGFFGTTINRAKHPFKIVNTTGYFPDKISIGLGLDREVFFSAKYESAGTQENTYAAMLSRELREYQGDMYGLILSAASISRPQSFAPTWSENRKNIFDDKNIKFQLISQDRISNSLVFEFKQPTTTERFTAMNSGWIPFREYNESIAEEVFFRGPEFEQTYFDRLFNSETGEYTKYRGEVFGIILGSTLGQSGSFSPYLEFGPHLVKPEDFKIPLNKYDKRRILELKTFDFKEAPIKERGRSVNSTNIMPRKDLINLAADSMFFKGSILNQDTSITIDEYGDFLILERGRLSNAFGLLLASTVNDKLLGSRPYWQDVTSKYANFNDIRINSKTKTLLQKIQPFKFLLPFETDRYRVVNSETAKDATAIQNAQSLLDLIKYGEYRDQRDGKITYAQKLKNDYAENESTFKGLILAASRLGVKAARVKAVSTVYTSDLTELQGPNGEKYGVVNGNSIQETSYVKVGGPRFPNEQAGEQHSSPDTIEQNLDDQFIETVTKDRIKKLGPFEFRYPSDWERLEAMTADKINRENNPKMALGPNIDRSSDLYSQELDTSDDFTTLDYMQFGLNHSPKGTDPSDFRELLKIEKYIRFSHSPDTIDYNKLDIERLGQYSAGFGNPGKRGFIKAFPFITNIKYTSGLAKNVKDSYKPEDKSRSRAETYRLANRRYGAYPTIKDEVITLNDKSDNAPLDRNFWNGFRGDRINIIDWKRQEYDLNLNTVYEHDRFNDSKDHLTSAQDSIQFYFSGVDLRATAYRPTEALVFRAHLDTIVDNHKPTWTPIKYIGRADPVYSYDGYEREISFGFTIHIGSRDELKATWRKLNMLASWTSPDYIDPGFMKAPICRLNIGNLYRKFPGFISTLNYTFDNTQTTWETAKLAADLDLTDNQKVTTADGTQISVGELSRPGALELPKTIIVQCTFVTFNIYRPQWDCVFYSLFDDRTASGFETGLLPMSGDVVNYFRTHDDLPMNHPMNALLCGVVPPPPPDTSKIPPTTTLETTEIITTTPIITETPTPTPPPPTPTPTFTGTGTPSITETVTPGPTPTPTPSVTEKIIPPCVCKIDFCFDEDREITPPSRNTIRTYVAWLKRCPDLKVKVTGYCSKEKENPVYNIYLSWARATTVANLLIEEFGIDPNRLTIDGQGFGSPVTAVQKTKKGKSAIWPGQANRRVEITPLSGESIGCEPPKACPPKDCPVTKRCWRKDGTKFWRVGPHYFTGTALIEENGKNVGQSYTGWPQGFPNKALYYEDKMSNDNWKFKLPAHVDQKTTFNSFTKLNLTPEDEDRRSPRDTWADTYYVQEPDNSDAKPTSSNVKQNLYKSWFTPLKDAKQTYEIAHIEATSADGPKGIKPRLRNPNEPIDIWQRRKDRDAPYFDNDPIKGKTPKSKTYRSSFGGYIGNKNHKGYNSDGLDDYTYIFDPDQ